MQSQHKEAGWHRKIKVRGVYRSGSHLPIWEVLQQGRIAEAGLGARQFEYCRKPPDAERALFKGDIDFISGDHLTPYDLVVQGKPIVSIASPVNGQTPALSWEPIVSLHDLRGKRIVDTRRQDAKAASIMAAATIYDLIRAGMSIDDVQWVESENADEQFAALKSRRADARFVSGGERYKDMGMHILPLGPLPMINGPTLTTSYTVLHKKKGIGERLVKALVLGIHFAKTQRQKTQKFWTA